MARAYVNVPIDAQVFERLQVVKQRSSDLAFQTDNTISISAAIGLLLDHWQECAPDLEWLRAQAKLYPRRGRPKRTEKDVPRLYVGGKLDPDRGHEFATPASNPALRVCKHCQFFFRTDDIYGNTPPHYCPRFHAASVIKNTPFNREQLLGFGFTEAEVTWL